jgi:hypothetical protein
MKLESTGEVIADDDPIFSPLVRTMKKNLLRYMVGRVIFCPGATCGGQVLDARRAIAAGSTVICVKCWQGLDIETQQAVLALGDTDPDTLLDGPSLHGNKPKLVVTKL